MNNKEKIITGIQNARNMHERWLNQSCLLLDREYIHTVQEPTACTECELTHLLTSEENTLRTLGLFDDLTSLHQDFHDANKVVFDQAQENFNPEKLQNQFASLETHSHLLVRHLDEIKLQLENTDEDSLLGYFVSNQKNEENIIEESIKDVATLETKQSSLHKRLKQQDLERLVLEQELTKQELKQLEERQDLTRLSIEQALQYQQLKREEINGHTAQYDELEQEILNNQESTTQEIITIKQKILLAQDELEPLLWVDLKYGEMDKLVQEQKIIATFDGSLDVNQKEIDRLEQQRQKWQYEIESLKRQIALIQEDINTVEKEQKEKQALFDESNESKDFQLLELEQNVLDKGKQQEDKSIAKEHIEIEIKQLEHDLLSKNQTLDSLKVDAENLKDTKVEAKKHLEYQLIQMKDDCKFKQHKIDALDKNKAEKNSQLAELSNQQKLAESSLKQLEKLEEQQITQANLNKLDQIQQAMDKMDSLAAV